MKKSLIAIMALCVVGAASATGLNLGDTTNNHGGKGGDGGEAAAISGSASKSTSVGVGISGAASKSSSGGNIMAVTVDGDDSNTPPVIAGNIPAVPTSCRLYMFGGGSTRDGAGSGTIPLGNDQTCLSIAKLNLMDRVGGFTQAEKQAVVCKVEGMSELATCRSKKPAMKTADAPSVPTEQYVGSGHIIRR